MNERGRTEDFIKQMDRISFQSHRIAEIQKYISSFTSDLLLEKATDLMTAVVQFLRSSLLYLKHDYFYNLGKTLLLGPQIYSEGKLDLDSAIAEYDQALLLQVASTLLASSMERREAENSVIGEEFLRWLKPSKFEVEAQLLKNRQFRAPGTLQWVLELPELSRWRCASEEKLSALWLSGLPGVGKSIISAFMIDILKAQYPNAIVLYFFVNAGEPGLNTVSATIRTLAAQLAEADAQARQRLQMLMAESFVPTATTSPSQLIQQLIQNSILGLSQPIYIVLDGLDEYCSLDNDAKSHSPVGEMLGALLSTRCYLLVASRPTPTINTQLHHRPTRALGFEDNCNDIALYVRSRVTQSNQLRRGFEKLSINAEEYMLSRSKGSFLWVSIVLRLLEETTSVKSFKTTLETLPQVVGNLYDAVLGRLESAQNLGWALAILEWTLFSYRQLTLEELQIGIEKTLDDAILDLTQFIRADCGMFLCLIPHNSGRQAVQIGHELFRSYLTESNMCKHKMVPYDIHAKMARVCLDVLCDDSEEAASLNEYACRYWHQHLSATNFSYGQAHSLAQSLERFLKGTAFSVWVRHVGKTMRVYIDKDLWSFLLNVHDSVIAWANSGSGTVDTSRPSKESDWTNQLLGSQTSYDSLFCSTLGSVWLATTWDDFNKARHVYMSALKLCRIFALVGPESPTPVWSGPFQPPDGWGTWRWRPSRIDYEGTAKQIDALLQIGSYNESLNVHCFNRAVAHKESDLEAAEDLFVKALDGDPEYFLYHEGLGQLYEMLGRSKDMQDHVNEALRCYEKAMKLDPREIAGCSEDYWELLASSRKANKDINGARQAYREALQHPVLRNGEVYWNRLSCLYEDDGDLDGAKNILREALRAYPEDGWKYWPRLAHLERKEKKTDTEVEVYLEAIAYDPEYAGNYRSSIISLAYSLRECQTWDVACRILSRAIDRDEKGELDYKVELAKTYLSWGHWAEALKTLNDLASLATENKPFAMWYEMGDAYLGLGEFEKSISAYKESISRKSDPSPSCIAYLARAYAVNGQHELAVREFKNAIRTYGERTRDKKNSFLGQVFVWLAFTYQTLGRPKDTEEMLRHGKQELESIIAPYSDDTSDRTFWRIEAREHSLLGFILVKLGDPASARLHFQKAIEVFELTTHVEDDEMEQSEHQEVVKVLTRLEAGSAVPPISLLEEEQEEKMFRLRRDLVQKRRKNWGVDAGKKPPRRMGGA
jgi:tetratricopeptide (TPR) repeat protein/Cdc6-like AAA superfamily ATPase